MSRKTAERNGTMLVKVSAEVHGRVRVAAAVMGESIKQFVETAVERRLVGMREGVEAGKGGKRRVVEVSFDGDEAGGSGLVGVPAERGKKTARGAFAGGVRLAIPDRRRADAHLTTTAVRQESAVPVVEDDEPFNPAPVSVPVLEDMASGPYAGGPMLEKPVRFSSPDPLHGIPYDADTTVQREYQAQPRSTSEQPASEWLNHLCTRVREALMQWAHTDGRVFAISVWPSTDPVTVHAAARDHEFRVELKMAAPVDGLEDDQLPELFADQFAEMFAIHRAPQRGAAPMDDIDFGLPTVVTVGTKKPDLF